MSLHMDFFWKASLSNWVFLRISFFCFLTITTSNLHQIQNLRSVFKSAGSKDFKTVPSFDNWPSGKCENWKWPLVSLSSIFTASTWSIIKSRDSFEILRTCRFKNWPYFLNLVKIWGSYSQKQNFEILRTTLQLRLSHPENLSAITNQDLSLFSK